MERQGGKCSIGGEKCALKEGKCALEKWKRPLEGREVALEGWACEMSALSYRARAHQGHTTTIYKKFTSLLKIMFSGLFFSTLGPVLSSTPNFVSSYKKYIEENKKKCSSLCNIALSLLCLCVLYSVLPPSLYLY